MCCGQQYNYGLVSGYGNRVWCGVRKENRPTASRGRVSYPQEVVRRMEQSVYTFIVDWTLHKERLLKKYGWFLYGMMWAGEENQ